MASSWGGDPTRWPPLPQVRALLPSPASSLACFLPRPTLPTASHTRFTINKAHNPPLRCNVGLIDFRRILTCVLCFHTVKKEREREAQGLRRGPRRGRCREEGVRHRKTSQRGQVTPWSRAGRARAPSLPGGGASEDPLERPPNLPLGEVEATVGGATSCGVLPNCSQVAQMEEFLIATAKDPNNECPTPK